MSEYYLLTHENGKVSARRVKKNRSGHWEAFGKVELYDLPIPEIRMAVEIQAVIEKHRNAEGGN